MAIAVLGIDLGKNSCSVAGLDGTGRVVLRRRLTWESVVRLAGAITVSEGDGHGDDDRSFGDGPRQPCRAARLPSVSDRARNGAAERGRSLHLQPGRPRRKPDLVP